MILYMSIITSTGNHIPLDMEDEEIVDHIFHPASCAKIVIHQINNDKMYDNYLKDKTNPLASENIRKNLWKV
jgi:hypothetical protein